MGGTEGKRIRLYALSTCPSCRRVKELLDSFGIGYELIDVDTLESGEQWAATREMKKYNPAATYPTLVVEEVVVGADEARIKELLGLHDA